MTSIIRILILFGSLLLHCRTHGQSLSCNWLHTVGDTGNLESQGTDATTDLEGNFIVSGSFEGTIDVDPSDTQFLIEAEGTSAYVAKLSPEQVLIWAFKLGDNSSVHINKVRVLQDDRILLCGNFTNTCDFDPSNNQFIMESVGFFDAFMAIYSSDGDFINSIRIGGNSGDELGIDAVIDADSNYYFTGFFYASADLDPTFGEYIVEEYSGASFDLFIIKLSPQFEFIWGGTVSGPWFEFPSAICLDESNDLLIAGLVESSPDFDLTDSIQYATVQVEELNLRNCFLAKYTLDGSLIEAKIFGGEGDDYIVSLDSNDAGYLISGTYSGNGDFDPGTGTLDFDAYGDNDAFVMQLDTNFNALWHYNIGSEEPDYFNDVAIDSNGNIAVSGSFEMTIDFDNGEEEYLLSVPETFEGLYPDAIVVLLSADGQFKEAQNFGSWDFDRAHGVAISGSKVLLTGYFTYRASLGTCVAETSGESYQEEAFVLCLDSEYLSVESQETFPFSVFPNPADQFINIVFSKLESLSDAEIKLYDMRGRLIKQTLLQHNQATYMFDCSTLENGTYLLSIESERFVTTKKIVVTR